MSCDYIEDCKTKPRHKACHTPYSRPPCHSKEREGPEPHEIPEYIMMKLRQREGMEKNDKSRDEEFSALDPEVIFGEVVSWELGDGGWGNTLLNWAVDCGIKIEGK